ncbi:nucleotide kinase domain-containing protein [Sphingomonas sp. LY54]|uniref:nucleotide kinase domain-containing protein n=1 Tax=Sphingomonas sp. LY54 TaxID=3095343 RepID=UPI002D78D578|nr:nucleotide kinase domain-containing protein [Sphingomonas sp. LY54]WRP30029.1 nucleotide kinase domain-containing protein [Sphingomonas sp. LY54]
MTPTAVYDSYWRFAAERHAIYERRLTNPQGPWTDDPILAAHRFTNTYRAADRVSQYLIGDVQYRPDRSQAPAELFFRTLLFKIFNKIETWELIERQLGPVSWQSIDLAAVDALLGEAMGRRARIYSAAYIMPSPQLGHARKHANHLALLARMMDDGLPARVERARSLAEVYELLSPYPGLGPFLTYQYAIDLNYSNLLDFSEADFVVAGPGALDGIAKCFEDTGGRSAREVIEYMADVQDREFAARGIDFKGLFGRKLQLIDCQNIFCEISKYARVAHPEVRGVSGRTRIKQSYRPSPRAEPAPFFPPRWKLNVPLRDARLLMAAEPAQGQLFARF